MTLLENQVFANVVKMRSHWIGADPDAKTGVFIRERTEIWTQRHTQEGSYVTTETEIGLMQLQTKFAKDCRNHQKLEEAGRILP